MGAFGIVVVVVLVGSIAVGLLLLRRPNPWDEIGADGLGDVGDGQPAEAPSTSPIDDEAELRALIDRKREARRARGEPDRARPVLTSGPPWAHVDSEVVEEARSLVARRQQRLAREGKPEVMEQAELERLLGPPYL